MTLDNNVLIYIGSADEDDDDDEDDVVIDELMLDDLIELFTTYHIVRV